MRALIDPFVQLCLFRTGPQDLPYSPMLLGIVIASNSLVGVIGLLARGFTLLASVTGGLLDSAIMSALAASLLVTMGQRARLSQTLTALLGSATVIGTLALPVQLVIQSATGREADTSLPELLSLVALCWFLAVTAHILRHALSVHYGIAMMVSFMFFVLSNLVLVRFLEMMLPAAPI